MRLTFFKPDIGIIATSIAMIALVYGCKKSTTSSNTQSYVNASVNGTAFRSMKAGGLVVEQQIAVAGESVVNADTIVVDLAFEKGVPLNSAISTGTNQNNGIGYASSPNTGDSFTSDSTRKASGTYTITAINYSDSTATGTFSGTVIDESGKTNAITNGTFHSTIKTNSLQGLLVYNPGNRRVHILSLKVVKSKVTGF